MNGNGFEGRERVHISKDERYTITKITNNITGSVGYELYSPISYRQQFSTLDDAKKWMYRYQNRDRG